MGMRITTHNLDGTTTTVDTRTLADAQAEALGRLGAQYASIIAAGLAVTVQGVSRVYQIDDASQIKLAGAGMTAIAAFTAGGSWPAGFYWIAADNSTQPMTADDCLAFAKTISAYVTAVIYAYRAAKDVIAAIDNINDCDTFDVTTGWPA